MSRIVGQIRVNFLAETAQFGAGVKKNMSALAAFGGAFGKAGAAATKAIGGMVSGLTSLKTVAVGALAAIATSKFVGSLNAAAEEVDRIGKAAKRLGITAEQMSALRYAAGESGVEFETLAKLSSKALQMIAKEAEKGGAWVAVGRLNVRLRDASGNVRSLTELLPDLARGIESAGSQAEQLNLAQKFFGRQGGDQFITLLKESGTFVKGLAEQTERARRLGIVFTEDQVDRLTAYNDAVGRIKEAWLGLRVAIIDRVAPALTELANKAASAVASIPKIIERAYEAARQFFGDGGPLADQLSKVFKNLGEVAKAGAVLLVRAAYGVAVDMLRAVWPSLRNEFEYGFNEAILKTLSATLETAAGVAAVAFPKLAGSIYIALNPLNQTLNSMQKAAEALRANDPFANFREVGFIRQWGIGWEGVEKSVGALVVSADELLDISGEIARRSMTGINLFGDAAEEARESVGDLARQVAEFRDEGGREIQQWGGQVANQFADVALGAKVKFGEIARSWARTLIAMGAQKFALGPLFNSLGSAFAGVSGRGGAGPDVAGPANPEFNAHGGFARPRMLARGDVLTRPIYFPRYHAVAGEAGPEAAFAPLTRIGQDLGVKSVPSPITVQVIDQRSGGAPIQTSEARGPSGQKMLRILVRDEVSRAIQDGSLDGKMSSVYGASRRGVQRG